MLLLLWPAVLMAQPPTCAIRELTRLPDQAFVGCDSGPLAITPAQHALIRAGTPPQTLCLDGTTHAAAWTALQFDTPTTQPEACDVFDASNGPTAAHLRHIQLPDGRILDIDTRTHVPQRDGLSRLTGFTPPVPGVAITGRRTASLWQRVLAWLSPASVRAAVTFDAASSGDGGTNLVTTLQYSLTVASQANRALYVGLCTANGSADETTVDTFNSDNMTLLARTNSTVTVANAYLFRLTNPDAVTGNVDFTLSTGRRVASGAIALYGVDQTTPDDTPGTTANAGDTQTISVSVTTATDDLLVDIGCKRDTAFALSMVTTTNRTQRYADNSTNATTGNNIVVGGSTRTGTGSLAMDWQDDGDPTQGLAVVAVNVNQSVAAVAGRKGVPLWFTP